MNMHLQMTNLALHMFGMALFGLATPALQAQSIDAPRYVNAQGVEVIQGRRAPSVPVPAVAVGEGGRQGAAPGPTSKTVKMQADAAQARPASYQIGAGEQQQRDRDRRAILEDELRAEHVSLDSKIRVLQSAELRGKLDPDALKRLQETTLDHEKNIRALHAELTRAKKSR
jgi:hypothetical protein